MANGYEILYPANATRVLKEQTPMLLKEGKTPWMARTPINDADEDEMTLRYKSRIFAADIVTEDSTALARESGQFTAVQYGSNKLKHGKKLNEKWIRMLRKLEKKQFVGDNEIVSFRGWVGRSLAELHTGANQRVEGMINGMLAGGYHYDRLGLKIDADFGMASENKYVAATPHSSTSSTPLKDIVTAFIDQDVNWNQRFNHITCRYDWITAVVATDEFKAEAARAINPYQLASSIGSMIEARSANYPQQAATIGKLLTDMVGWPVTVEVNENVFYEYKNNGAENWTAGAATKYHPDNMLFFTNSSTNAFDIGNGELVEAILGDMGCANVIGSFHGAGFNGPMGYTVKSPDLNPPTITTWVTAWMAPRLQDERGIANMQWK